MPDTIKKNGLIGITNILAQNIVHSYDIPLMMPER